MVRWQVICSKLSARTLVAAFVALSAALSMGLLAVRNLYDDEILSFGLIRQPVRSILSGAAEGDVHPPGMYLLAHWSHALVPSCRWMNLFAALALYAGLTVFLLRVVPLVLRLRAQVCLLLLATLHPQLLMWGNSFRWYSWWTGLALVTLVVALQPSRAASAEFSRGRALALGVLFAGLFYLNYITLLFLAALVPAMAARYRQGAPRTMLLARGLLSLALCLLLTAPQLHTMLTVHLPNGRAQRYSVVLSALRLLQSVATSEAYLPWHPLAISAVVVFFLVYAAGLRGVVRRWSEAAGSPVLPVVLFGGSFFVLVAGSGLGGKPRSGLLLIPVLAAGVGRVVDTMRPKLQTALLLLYALWSGVGIAHLFTRSGLTKSMMTDRPEQVVRFLAAAEPARKCAVVITDDSSLAFALAQSRMQQLLIVSPYRGPIFGGDRTLPPGGCDQPRMYVVHSYLGGTATRAAAYDAELVIAETYLQPPVRRDAFSPDPDAARKRRLAALSPDLASVERLPDFRYVVVSGTVRHEDIQALRQKMPAFLSGFRSSVLEGAGVGD